MLGNAKLIVWASAATLAPTALPSRRILGAGPVHPWATTSNPVHHGLMRLLGPRSCEHDRSWHAFGRGRNDPHAERARLGDGTAVGIDESEIIAGQRKRCPRALSGVEIEMSDPLQGARRLREPRGLVVDACLRHFLRRPFSSSSPSPIP